MKPRVLAAKYALFAAISTAVNLGLQWAVLRLVDSAAALYLAILAGTAGGLVVKYILDCRFIFAYVNRPRMESLATFAFYVLVSGITTIVFWGTELLCDTVIHSKAGSYAGAALGLALGYTLKYHLDRKLVFSRRHS